MGKAEAGTPKAIANRIKSKGLQKLRWYCQMCQKQCRDENGFKCHCMAESHQRQLLLFADNPDTYLDTFSKEFYDDFIYLLSRRFGTKRVHGNIVYQEYVSERDHTHMNSTKWETLTDFVKWLGREGHCVVDETPKGWFITYIDKDPEVIARQKASESKVKHEMDDQERIAQFVERQIERAQATQKETSESQFTDLQRDDETDKVQFDFGGKSSGCSSNSTADKSSAGTSSKDHRLEPPKKLENILKKAVTVNKPYKDKSKPKRKSALDEILEEEEKKKKRIKSQRKENWLTEGIVVKIVTKKLGDKYYKKKAIIKEVKNLYIGIVQLVGSEETTLKFDQTHLETVLPAPGRLVKIVNGEYYGSIAEMLSIDEKKYTATVKIKEGRSKGQTVRDIAYEDISKLAV